MDEQSPIQEKPQITINDLKTILQIIDVSATRGAFHGNELTNVGTIRDRLAAFLESVETTEANNTKNA